MKYLEIEEVSGGFILSQRAKIGEARDSKSVHTNLISLFIMVCSHTDSHATKTKLCSMETDASPSAD